MGLSGRWDTYPRRYVPHVRWVRPRLPRFPQSGTITAKTRLCETPAALLGRKITVSGDALRLWFRRGGREIIRIPFSATAGPGCTRPLGLKCRLPRERHRLRVATRGMLDTDALLRRLVLLPGRISRLVPRRILSCRCCRHVAPLSLRSNSSSPQEVREQHEDSIEYRERPARSAAALGWLQRDSRVITQMIPGSGQLWREIPAKRSAAGRRKYPAGRRLLQPARRLRSGAG